jgi:hypothetical protein
MWNNVRSHKIRILPSHNCEQLLLVVLLQVMTTLHRSTSQHLSNTNTVRIFFSVLFGEERPGRKYHDSDWYRDSKIDSKRLGHGAVACSLPIEE